MTQSRLRRLNLPIEIVCLFGNGVACGRHDRSSAGKAQKIRTFSIILAFWRSLQGLVTLPLPPPSHPQWLCPIAFWFLGGSKIGALIASFDEQWRLHDVLVGDVSETAFDRIAES